MVYKNVLCYTTIEIMHDVVTEECNLDRSTFPQNGTHTSLLALLRVNHQVYDEGRRLFCGHNTFIF
ncbi:hypothetical protein BDV41DRAFT_523631 [Aspergillus transmontanensis]|uniref:Uncharacterized protein n=1 Tax=Aspergillus transmontanensis TaxID=1034304 RepID=A0A5N6WBG8_9EURO|nr:hypothetical protein BDV41DRAFT_523631 [Aspergillus transmontanensis]